MYLVSCIRSCIVFSQSTVLVVVAEAAELKKKKKKRLIALGGQREEGIETMKEDEELENFKVTLKRQLY